ncbi:MAG: hypothetical protein ACFFG0_30225 [Candidatus Thorarchaeota archaeon]
MITKDVIKIYQKTINQFEENLFPDISGAVMTYSDVKKFEEPQYIYNGDEEIPFDARHPEYQRIFKEEFLE